MNRNLIHHGALIMLGLVAGAVLTLVVGQKPATDDYVYIKLNNHIVPIYGRWVDDNHDWRIINQDWNPSPPIFRNCPSGLPGVKRQYSIEINGKRCVAVGRIDAKGRFLWCWDDQVYGGRASQPGEVAPQPTDVGDLVSLANGVDATKFADGGPKIYTSGPEVLAEVEKAMVANPPASEPSGKTPPIPLPPAAGMALWFGKISMLDLAVRGGVVVVILASLVVVARHKIRG